MTSRHGIAMERAGDEGEGGWDGSEFRSAVMIYFLPNLRERGTAFFLPPLPSPPLLLLEFIKGSDAAV